MMQELDNQNTIQIMQIKLRWSSKWAPLLGKVCKGFDDLQGVSVNLFIV